MQVSKEPEVRSPKRRLEQSRPSRADKLKVSQARSRFSGGLSEAYVYRRNVKKGGLCCKRS